jgi:tripartite-type tricarboxylate transporter receptor subunit TctC
MIVQIRGLSVICSVVLALSCAAMTAQAADGAYPAKPIRIIVPYPPGGSTDPTARAFATWLSEKWGVSIVIDNRAGAGSTIGHALGAAATPDGYTLLLGTSGGLVVSPAIGTKVQYDSIKDFAPIGLCVYTPFLLVVHPAVAAKNTTEFIELAKAHPGQINFGSPGTGTPNHLGIELLTALSGAKFTHVPYKGGGPVTVDLLAGRIQAVFGSVPQWQPHLATGRARAIAIGHPTRLAQLPDVPAVAETIPGFNNTSWYALFAPTGTPPAIIAKINAEMKHAVANAEFSKFIESIGLVPASSTPTELGDLVKSELVRWTKVIRDAGIRVD